MREMQIDRTTSKRTREGNVYECVWGRQLILLSYKPSDGSGCVATGNTQREGTGYD